MIRRLSLATVHTLAAAAALACGPRAPAIVSAAFISDPSPTPGVHASTIVETPSGLVAAWFGGEREGAPDVGIWMSRRSGDGWSPPVEIADGRQADGTRFPCYNPVLFRTSDGALHLFYKVGPQPALWWGMAKVSRDDGVTWSEARRLPDGVLGPIKNKPALLGGGASDAGLLVSPSSTESYEDPPKWRVHFELSRDAGATWSVVTPDPGVDSLGRPIESIQPAIVVHADGALQALGRTRSGRAFETWSRDSGMSWTPLRLTTIPNPNSGFDAIALRDGRSLMVYNHSTSSRTPLTVAIAPRGGEFAPALTLETDSVEFSYPSVIQANDGLVHVTYTVQRRWIKHVTLYPGH